jgi:CHAD domain-containing protein
MSTAPQAFTLSWHQQSADSFARVLRRIAARARSLAADQRFSTEQAVHEVRLLIKRVRALLWFARPSLAGRSEAEARAQLRKAAQLLAGHRDVKAAQATFDKILEEVDSGRARVALEKTSQVMRDRNGIHEPDSKSKIAKAIEVLCKEITDFAQAVERSAKWPSATKRTEKAFRAMRKSGRKAERTEEDSDFHAWRKKAKRLLYLLEMRDGDASRRQQRLLKRIDKLQSVLGDDHDCVVAAQQLAAPGEPRNIARVVSKVLGERQRRLRKKSRKLARRIDAAA